MVRRPRQATPERDRCLRASAASLLEHSAGENGIFTAEWHEGARDRRADFNSHTSALVALIALLPDANP